MTANSGGDGTSAFAGWYRDPAGSDQLRWWDGAGWTEHLAANPPQASPHTNRSRSRPQISPSTPVYNAFIWLVVLLPLVSMILMPTWHPVLRIEYVGVQRIRAIDPASLFSPWYVFLVLLGLAIDVLMVVFAALDRRKLERDGVWWPFHWAWAILAAPIYIIGRSVIVHKVAHRRGLAPIWVFIAVTLLTFVAVIISEATLFHALGR
jgi:hypothetical protein